MKQTLTGSVQLLQYFYNPHTEHRTGECTAGDRTEWVTDVFTDFIPVFITNCY